MLCPICKVDLIVVEYKRIELDHCLKCRGVWFDSGELELLLRGVLSETGAKLDYREAKALEARRRCPVCGRKMDKVVVGQDPEVLVDVCPAGDGLWFDGGELAQLVRQRRASSAVAKPGDKTLAFLGETFRATTGA